MTTSTYQCRQCGEEREADMETSAWGYRCSRCRAKVAARFVMRYAGSLKSCIYTDQHSEAAVRVENIRAELDIIERYLRGEG